MGNQLQKHSTMKTNFTLAALLAATTTMATNLPDDNCCTVWAGE